MIEKKIDRWLSAGLGLLAFTVYFAARRPAASGVPEPVHLVLQTAWDALSSLLSHGAPAWLSALAGALCGGLTVALVYLVMRSSLSAVMRPEAEPGAYLNDRVTRSVREEAGLGASRDTLVAVGAAVGSLYFAFGAPFWSSSPPLPDGVFEALFLMSLLGVLLRGHTSGKRKHCLTALFLCGLGAADSPVFLWSYPVVFFVIVRGLILTNRCSERILPLYLLSGLAGLAIGVGAFFLASGSQDPTAAIQEYGRHYVAALGQAGCHGSWCFVWGIPAVVLILSVSRARDLLVGDKGLGVAGGVLLMGVTAVILANAQGIPLTAWREGVRFNYLPVVPSLMLAFAAGCLFVCWLNMGLLEDDSGQHEKVTATSVMRMVGLAACGLMVIVLFRQPCVVAKEMRGSDLMDGSKQAMKSP